MKYTFFCVYFVKLSTDNYNAYPLDLIDNKLLWMIVTDSWETVH